MHTGNCKKGEQKRISRRRLFSAGGCYGTLNQKKKALESNQKRKRKNDEAHKAPLLSPRQKQYTSTILDRI